MDGNIGIELRILEVFGRLHSWNKKVLLTVYVSWRIVTKKKCGFNYCNIFLTRIYAHTHIIYIYICINTHVFCHQAKEVCWSTSGFRGTLFWTNSHWCRAMNVLMGKYRVGERLIHLIASIVPADLLVYAGCWQMEGIYQQTWGSFSTKYGEMTINTMGEIKAVHHLGMLWQNFWDETGDWQMHLVVKNPCFIGISVGFSSQKTG